MTERTAAEARAHNISLMGPDLGAVYSELWQEVAWLHHKWSEYVELFGTRESRVDLLNEAAPSFARVLQDSLWETALVHISRVTDRPQTARRDNLTVQCLPDLVGDETRPELQAAIDQALTVCAFARDWRNRRIAHGDFLLAMDESAEPLQAASRQSVNEALQSITAVLNVIERRYRNGGETLFDWGGVVGGALELLHVIESGVRAGRERQARLETGQPHPDDWAQRDV